MCTFPFEIFNNKNCSFRSTKSEKMYPSMLSRGPDVEIEPYYCLPVGTMQSAHGTNTNGSTSTAGVAAWSQPTSPTPPSRFSSGTLSPTHATYRLTYPKKNDEGNFFSHRFPLDSRLF